ncbi:MAG TPA: TolC family protein [Bacteroidota bacterium]|nr:TolC family protein [Bacteroidota bacterium]
MSRIHTTLTLCAAVMLLAGYAPAQSTLNLTIDQAIQTGIANSKSLHASSAKVAGAEAKASEAGAARFPTLKAAGLYTRLSDVPAYNLGPFPPLLMTPITIVPSILNNYTARMTVQQPLFTGFALTSNVNLTSYNADATAKDFERDRAELIYAVRSAYWTYYKTMEFKKVIDEVVEQMKAHLHDVQNMFAQGVVTKNELLRVEVQLSNAEVTQIDAGNNVELAMIGLNNTIGLPLKTNIVLTSTIGRTEHAYQDTSVLIMQALERRPEVQAMDLRVKAGESGVTLARSGWWPQVGLIGNYYYSRPNQRYFPAIDAFKNTWDVSLSVSLDIWNWGTTLFQTREAEAQLVQAQDALSQLKDGISLEVTQCYLGFRESDERIHVAEQAVGQAEENARITSEKFRSGLVLNSDVLDAEVALLQAKWNYIQALVDHELADARLQKAIAAERQ